MTLGPTTIAVLEAIGELGYVVDIEHHGQHVVTTTPTSERWTVRGHDLYAVACELAEQVGIESGDA